MVNKVIFVRFSEGGRPIAPTLDSPLCDDDHPMQKRGDGREYTGY